MGKHRSKKTTRKEMEMEIEMEGTFVEKDVSCTDTDLGLVGMAVMLALMHTEVAKRFRRQTPPVMPFVLGHIMHGCEDLVSVLEVVTSSWKALTAECPQARGIESEIHSCVLPQWKTICGKLGVWAVHDQ